ncbi:MAG: hypothetical protein IPP49_14890 [Saprospiraceae bacterium]|nr:hypothetical protein [Saprospiraceae bacterium]
MRSIWKGHIRFSLVTIPVVIFNGLEAENELSFKQLHDKDNGKINYKKVCSSCQEEVPFGNIVKGYEYESERFVVFKKEELETIKLKSTKVIDIEAFVDISEVHPSRYEALYFIGPNGGNSQSYLQPSKTCLASVRQSWCGQNSAPGKRRRGAAHARKRWYHYVQNKISI